jgi:hypothetical protein
MWLERVEAAGNGGFFYIWPRADMRPSQRDVRLTLDIGEIPDEPE